MMYTNDQIQIPAYSIRLLTGNEVANILNISRAFAYRLMKEGTIPTVRIGSAVRVRYESLQKFIDENTMIASIS